MPWRPASCPALLQVSVDQSYRIFNCSSCSLQTILCRNCDHGNIYCSHICAEKRRQVSRRRAGRLYQSSFGGRLAHAHRQARYRHRIKAALEKVTHHGSSAAQECGSVEETTAVQQISSKWSTIKRVLGREIRCDHCRRLCGPFARLEFWRGGRAFPKLRRHDAHNSRDRS